MTRPSFRERIETGTLLLDGAMGTQLHRAGLEPGDCGEAWNLDAPERVLAIHRDYVAAGSEALLSNTFGASRIALERHDQGARTVEINRAGVELARRALEDSGGYVIGDMGPSGAWLEPLGDLSRERLEQAFLEQAQALVEAGAEAILLETHSDLEELEIGIRAARAAGTSIVIGSMAFNRSADGGEVRTLLGVEPEQAAAGMRRQGVDVLGLNCGAHVDAALARTIVERYRRLCDLPILVRPNAGQPALENDEAVYPDPPETLAAGIHGLVRSGARLIGGCCGTTPDHIRLFRTELDRLD